MPVIKFLILLYSLYTSYTAATVHYDPRKLWATIDTINGRDSLSFAQKADTIKGYIDWFDEKHIPHDSVYAFMLHRMGIYKSKEHLYTEAIDWTNRALLVNRMNSKSCCKPYTAKHLFNLGIYYEGIGNPTTAYRYYDSGVQVIGKYYYYRDNADKLFEAYQNMWKLKNELDDFEGVVQVAKRGLQWVDSAHLEYKPSFESAIADASIRLKRYDETEAYYAKALAYYQTHHTADDTSGLINCWQTKANLAFAQNDVALAVDCLKRSIALCGNVYTSEKIAALGYQGKFYNSAAVHDFAKAKESFGEAIWVSAADPKSYNHISAYNNLGQVWVSEKNWQQALHCYQVGFALLTGMDTSTAPAVNPSFLVLKTLPSKPLLFTTLRNKAEMLMLLYRQNHQPAYMAAATSSFMLADSLLTDMRNNQSGDVSKLYWQEQTRNFFQQALEMCSLTNNPELAYRFMEKSRAVLLNDHLSEIGAGQYLPAAEQAREQALKMNVLEIQNQLNDLSPDNPEYGTTQKKLLDAQIKLEQFLHRLESNNPQYYQYKYADSIVPIIRLQQYLKENNQQWVQYFNSDSLLFVLYANGTEVKLYRRLVKNMDAVIDHFSHLSADWDWQNLHSEEYYQYAHTIYDTLLGALPLRPGRLIISADNALFPFDVLCRNVEKRSLMVNDYAISYAYSARFLLQSIGKEQAKPEYNFMGMAPVHFSNTTLQPLDQSAEALDALGSYYQNASLQTEKKATRQCLLNSVSKYAIINLYTHASSKGNAYSEPEIYLADSSLRLSELQMIQRPVTQMVVLSACETGAGKVADGEGVLSLARGFAMAAIPTTVATLWEVNEKSVYSITEQFHKNISQGMPKDVALQQAKLSWMKLGKDQRLPAYWAGIILSGDASAMPLQATHQSNLFWIGGLLIVGLLAIITFRFYDKKKREV